MYNRKEGRLKIKKSNIISETKQNKQKKKINGIINPMKVEGKTA